MVGIYKITSPSNKIYIGQSWNLDKRKRRYEILSCKNQVKLYNSLSKYGFDNHNFEIVYELPSDISQKVLDSYEIFYIEQFQSNIVGLNLTKGGKGSKGLKHSEITKEKQSKVKLGNKYCLNREYTSQMRDNMSKALTGLLVGDKNPFYNKNHTKETKDKLSLIRKIPIIQYDLNGNFIKEWDSQLDAKTQLKIDNISKVLKNKQKSAGSFLWRYKDEKFD